MNTKRKQVQEITDKVRCNNCYGVFHEDIAECPKCKTDAYLMQPFIQGGVMERKRGQYPKAPFTLSEVFETLPKSEKTLAKRGYRHFQWLLLNDTAYGPCFYRVVGVGKVSIGAVKYYKQRLLACYELAEGRG